MSDSSMPDTGGDAVRLAAYKDILDLINRRRAAESDEGIGVCIERQILLRELAALEQDLRPVGACTSDSPTPVELRD